MLLRLETTAKGQNYAKFRISDHPPSVKIMGRSGRNVWVNMKAVIAANKTFNNVSVVSFSNIQRTKIHFEWLTEKMSHNCGTTTRPTSTYILHSNVRAAENSHVRDLVEFLDKRIAAVAAKPQWSPGFGISHLSQASPTESVQN